MEYNMDKVIKKNSFVDKLGKRCVPVRLGDLLDEISWLSEVKKEQFHISMRTNFTYIGCCDDKEMLLLVDGLTERGQLGDSLVMFELFDNSFDSYPPEPAFCYSGVMRLNLNLLQADDKRLVEHCSAVVEKIDNKNRTTLVIDRDIDDVVCIFSLEEILSSSEYWYPDDLMRQAIINCSMRDIRDTRRSVTRVRSK